MKTHYDVLKLDKNCTPKEIKDSFIKLSKEYHPDKNKSSEAHKKFVEVNEAYSVLGKAFSRQTYDESLLHRKPTAANWQYNQYRHDTVRKTPYEEYAEKYADYARRSRGVNGGMSKTRGLLLCFFFMALGTALNINALRRGQMRSHYIAVQLRDSRLREKEYAEKRKAKCKEESEKVDVGEQ